MKRSIALQLYGTDYINEKHRLGLVHAKINKGHTLEKNVSRRMFLQNPPVQNPDEKIVEIVAKKALIRLRENVEKRLF